MIKKLTISSAIFFNVVTFAQVGVGTETPQATLDVAGNPADTASLDGIIAPRLTGEELRAKTYTSTQTGALVYVTAADTAPAGQTEGVTTAGYYYFDGAKWLAAGGANENIYNADGSLTDSRILNFDGNNLSFEGDFQQTNFSDSGLLQKGLTERAVIKLEAADVNGNGETTRLAIQANEDDYISIYSNGESKGITIETENTTGPSFLEFRTTPGGPGNAQRLLITGDGNIGVNAETPTEKFDVNGIVRFRELPLDGAANAHHTIGGDGASEIQDQTFTATRTVVADDNGVLGYVDVLPADVGTSKVIVSSQVSGNQNIGNANMLLGNFPNELIDINNAWTNNVFTVPDELSGLYMFSMQSAHAHDVNSQTNWFVTGILQKSTDGGSSWTNIMKDTNSGLAGSDVDNGVSINWTGYLNAGDKVRMLYHSNSSASNYVRMGSITITQLAQ